MFSKELENLIQATLEDGKLEENEKAALVKRAQKEGVDLNELEIYIKSLLQRRQRELNEKMNLLEEQYEKEKRKAIGLVCPMCKKQVPPLTLKCVCGYEFTTHKTSSSVLAFFEKINNTQLSKAEIDSCRWGEKRNINNQKLEELKEKKKLELISTFPIPNTKEDIIEFISLAAPHAKRKGGIMGSAIGRFCVFFCILVVILFVVGLLMFLLWPEELDSNYARSKAFETIGSILGGIFTFGFIIVFFAVVFYDQETLRWNKAARVWYAKLEQVLIKGRSLRGDSEFTQQLDYYENLINRK